MFHNQDLTRVHTWFFDLGISFIVFRDLQYWFQSCNLKLLFPSLVYRLGTPFEMSPIQRVPLLKLNPRLSNESSPRPLLQCFQRKLNIFIFFLFSVTMVWPIAYLLTITIHVELWSWWSIRYTDNSMLTQYNELFNSEQINSAIFTVQSLFKYLIRILFLRLTSMEHLEMLFNWLLKSLVKLAVQLQLHQSWSALTKTNIMMQSM